MSSPNFFFATFLCHGVFHTESNRDAHSDISPITLTQANSLHQHERVADVKCTCETVRLERFDL